MSVQARDLLAPLSRLNQTWTMGLLQDALASGRKFRTLSIEDAYTREMLNHRSGLPVPSLRVVRVFRFGPCHCRLARIRCTRKREQPPKPAVT